MDRSGFQLKRAMLLSEGFHPPQQTTIKQLEPEIRMRDKAAVKYMIRINLTLSVCESVPGLEECGVTAAAAVPVEPPQSVSQSSRLINK